MRKSKIERQKEQYLRISYAVLSHHNFKLLNGSSVKILLEICLRHSGFNNGKIAISLNQLADNLNISRSTAQRGIDQLLQTQFIVRPKKGYFTGRKASEYGVTFLNSKDMPASNIWGQAPRLKMAKRKNKKKLKVLSAIEQSLSDMHVDKMLQ